MFQISGWKQMTHWWVRRWNRCGSDWGSSGEINVLMWDQRPVTRPVCLWTLLSGASVPRSIAGHFSPDSHMCVTRDRASCCCSAGRDGSTNTTVKHHDGHNMSLLWVYCSCWTNIIHPHWHKLRHDIYNDNRFELENWSVFSGQEHISEMAD